MNIIRGGQIQLHQLRMTKQILKVALYVSLTVFVMSIAFRLYIQRDRHDYAAALSYKCAYSMVHYLPYSVSNKKLSFTYDNGGSAFKGSARKVVNNARFIKRTEKVSKLIRNEIVIGVQWAIGVFILLCLLWYHLGKRSLTKQQTSGGKVLTAKESNKKLRKLKLLSDLKIGDLHLVKNKETSHILISGRTGSGKSNCMHSLIPQIIQKKQPLFIVDTNGDMISRYYNAERGDVILNPFDERSTNWDFWQEIGQLKDPNFEINLNLISKSIFTTENKLDPFWTDSAATIFKDCVKYLIKTENRDITELFDMIAKGKTSDLYSKLVGMKSEVLLDKNNEKTAASIRSTLSTCTEFLEYLKQTSKRGISISKWITQLDKNESIGPILFLSASVETREVMKPLMSLWTNLLITKLMAQGPSQVSRRWIIIDELPSLQKLPSLPTILAEGRKYGICLMAGLQSANQLSKIYGREDSLTMVDQFNTKFIFATEEINFARHICAVIGEEKYKESSESLSYGSHEMRDGVNVSNIEKTELLIKPADLAALQDLEAYVKLPCSDIRLVKTKMKFIQMRLV